MARSCKNMIKIDMEGRRVIVEEAGHETEYTLDSPEAFAIISKAWLRSGWEAKHVYTFSWFGRPIIQLPEDLIRTQEVIYHLRPDVIVETGIAHGGSLIFYASLFEALHHGRVVGIDIDIREHNRAAMQAHPLIHRVTMIEGSSIDRLIYERVANLIKPNERVLVILDSNHSYDHVLGELELYSRIVSRDSYIVATDGIMKDLVGAPRAAADWGSNNPYEAAKTFAAAHPEFVIEQPAWAFNESALRENITHWPGAWLRRVR